MEAELGLDGFGDLTNREIGRGLLERRDELALGEIAEVAALGGIRSIRRVSLSKAREEVLDLVVGRRAQPRRERGGELPRLDKDVLCSGLAIVVQVLLIEIDKLVVRGAGPLGDLGPETLLEEAVVDELVQVVGRQPLLRQSVLKRLLGGEVALDLLQPPGDVVVGDLDVKVLCPGL